MHFKRADVDAGASYTIKARTPLIVIRWRDKIGIASINGWAAG